MKLKFFLVVLILTSVFCVSLPALAMTDQEKQALIAQIQQQIAQLTVQLQQMLAQQQGGTAWCHTFDSNLGTNNSGSDEVANLHIALQLQGFSYSPDPINTYSTGTMAAVQQFQGKYGISQTGFTGVLTRGKLNQLYGCSQTGNISGCTPNWQCENWGDCVNGQMTKACTDYNNCGTMSGVPSQTQMCTSGLSSSSSSGVSGCKADCKTQADGVYSVSCYGTVEKCASGQTCQKIYDTTYIQSNGGIQTVKTLTGADCTSSLSISSSSGGSGCNADCKTQADGIYSISCYGLVEKCDSNQTCKKTYDTAYVNNNGTIQPVQTLTGADCITSSSSLSSSSSSSSSGSLSSSSSGGQNCTPNWYGTTSGTCVNNQVTIMFTDANNCMPAYFVYNPCTSSSSSSSSSGELSLNSSGGDIACYPKDTKKCVGNSVYWYDSCNVKGAKVLDCPATQYCGTLTLSNMDLGCLNFICSANSNCGTDGYIAGQNSTWCSYGNVLAWWRTYTCNNSGTAIATCAYNDAEKLKQTCVSQQCSAGVCINQNQNQGQQCTADVQCGTSAFTGSPFCKTDNNVYQRYTGSKCVNSICAYTDEERLKQTCVYSQQCLNGTCISQSCTPNWQLGVWSTCTNGQMTRSVYDSNNCGTTTNMPSLTQACTTACTPNWQCGGWGTCASGLQTQTCTDSNNCGTTTCRPATMQACGVPGVLGCSKSSLSLSCGGEPVGNFDAVTNGVASGWAVYPALPCTPITVYLYIDGQFFSGGTFLASVTANYPRPDVTATYPAYTGNHGFVFTIPTKYQDGKTHTIYAYGIDVTAYPPGEILFPLGELLGSPKTFILPSSTQLPVVCPCATNANCPIGPIGIQGICVSGKCFYGNTQPPSSCF